MPSQLGRFGRRACSLRIVGPVSPRDRDEPVRLNRIYTRGGDGGETSLGDGSRVSKLDPLVRRLRRGRRAELAPRLGAASRPATSASPGSRTSSSTSAPTSRCPLQVDGKLRIDQAAIDRLEADCDAANAPLGELRSFVLPGGSEAASRLHIVTSGLQARRARGARGRRSERPLNPLALVYLNRLSDLLFVLARAANHGEEPLWRPGGER